MVVRFSTVASLVMFNTLMASSTICDNTAFFAETLRIDSLTAIMSFSVAVPVRYFSALTNMLNKIEGKAMIRNRYNYPRPSIRDIKGKETQARNN